MVDVSPQNLPITLLQQIPEPFPQPRFRLGDKVRWSNVPKPDFGHIIGVIYSDEASCRVIGLHYLILLDEKSPSRSICTHDFAFEDDIDWLEPSHSAEMLQRG